jgi:hypothetical protein
MGILCDAKSFFGLLKLLRERSDLLIFFSFSLLPHFLLPLKFIHFSTRAPTFAANL